MAYGYGLWLASRGQQRGVSAALTARIRGLRSVAILGPILGDIPGVIAAY